MIKTGGLSSDLIETQFRHAGGFSSALIQRSDMWALFVQNSEMQLLQKWQSMIDWLTLIAFCLTETHTTYLVKTCWIRWRGCGKTCCRHHTLRTHWWSKVSSLLWPFCSSNNDVLDAHRTDKEPILTYVWLYPNNFFSCNINSSFKDRHERVSEHTCQHDTFLVD